MPLARQQTKSEHPEATELYRKLIETYRVEHPDADTSRIEAAFQLALQAHKDVERETGEPYITHPLNVALICARLHMDEESIITALLHDTVEDTPVRLKKIGRVFGKDVERKVDALTKIQRIDLFARFTGRTMSDEQARNLQKLFVAMAQDFAVLVIKLADRLHNLRTVHTLHPDRIKRKAKETLDFYVPLARRLGLREIANEMEDICFRHLYSKEYEWILRELDKTVGAKTQLYERMEEQVHEALAQEGLEVEMIYGRVKSPYSTWRKIQKDGVSIDQVFDLIALRIVISGDEIDCYRAMGVIHGLYRPLFSRFRDFVAAPKSNGYQSLHTTVAGESGQITEIQIRTVWMNDVAEHGVAAHWKYKELSSQGKLSKTFSWFQFIQDLSEEHLDSRRFVEKTRASLTEGEVLVLSPQGEVVSLPKGATPLDFAYFIHTDLGHSTQSAKINSVPVPLDYELDNGDVVEVVKNPEGKPNPQPEWLNIVKSPRSVVKIKRWFRSRTRRERVEMGRFLLRQQITKEGLYPLNLMDNTKLLQLIKILHIRKIDDMFDRIAVGNLMADEVVKQLKHKHIQESLQPRYQPTASWGRSPFHTAVGTASELGIARKGGRPLRRKVELAACCTPVPGDEVFGLDNRKEHRVEIHHAHCPLGNTMAEFTVIPVEWSEDAKNIYYPTALHITALNRVGLLFDVMRELSELSVNLTGGNLNLHPSVMHGDEVATFQLMVEVQSKEQLKEVLETLRKVEDIMAVERMLEHPKEEN
jgi:guanosine-3',5'-bis(diphosphate) 3'-pyrophosphohydrolase